MTTQYTTADHVNFAFLVCGGLCAALIRKMPDTPKRAWIKLAAFVLVGSSALGWGIVGLQTELRRNISSTTLTGTLINLHTESAGRGSAQHYNIDDGTGRAMPDLYDSDALFFMKATNGERVEATFTKESGYVSHLRILNGPSAGYRFDEPDAVNTTPYYFFILVGFVIIIVGICQRILDHETDPTSE